MNPFIAALWRDETPVLLALLLACAVLLHRGLPAARGSLKLSLLFFAFWVGLDALGAALVARGTATLGQGLQQAAVLGYGVVLIRLAGLAVFRLLLPRLRVQAPRILEDIVVIGGYLLWGMVRLSYAGVELSSLVATSAVITAVLAFAMQDTLGNILGGLALQLDDSLAIGDWVKVADVAGRVVQIQWRYTAIVTRNGERVVVPNAQLMKGQFVVIGGAGSPGWRRWLWFSVDYAASPARVIAAATEGTASAEIPNVAREPAPSCVAMEFTPGAVRYALRYWLLDPQEDDATDSAVRCHLLATLQRQGWRIALPEQTVHVVPDDQAHAEAVHRREIARRLQVLLGIELFKVLEATERQQLAERLAFAPFARGDVVTRQGATAHWLYIIASGEAEVWWQPPEGERQLLSRLPPGSLFGEMGLMTGAPRAATVLAATDLECYRLDKAGFEGILQARPTLAEGLSQILAQRLHEVELARAALRDAPHEPAPHRADILQRIRDFFALS